jgi:hypothetical protein
MKFLSLLRRAANRARRSRFHHPRLEALECRTLPTVLMVTSPADDGQGTLRAAIADAQSGDQIVFDQSLQGQTITLTSGELAISKDLDIEGLGADQLAISGNHASRVFDISGGVAVTIAGLTITDGMVVGAPGQGGGILNNGSDLTVANDILSNNEAVGTTGQTGRGGAIANVLHATLTVTDSLFRQNQALGGDGGGPGNGGAIVVNASTATITDSTFANNQALGGPGGGSPGGGGIVFSGSTGTVTGSMFVNNQALGGLGGGSPLGGGIAFTNTSTCTISSSTFIANQAVGGDGGNGGFGRGGGIYNISSTVSVEGSTFTANEQAEVAGG